MKVRYKPIVLIVVGIIVGFPVFSIGYYTMVRTSTPQFCASCHEIEYAYDTWKTSSHANNSQGFVADCMDCHLPAPEDTYDFFYAKTYHGIKDIVKHFLLDPEEYDHEKNRERAYEDIDNKQCQKCHRNLLALSRQRGALLAHKTVLYPRPGYEKRCVDCHDHLVHFPKASYAFSAEVTEPETASTDL
jgi:cytochrome c-type protein NapC/trimethylamine-N-oxide reductase cytochrome c-type subunit TorC